MFGSSLHCLFRVLGGDLMSRSGKPEPGFGRASVVVEN